MHSETLERLLMDRALGELSPDVQALLAAYLEHDPAAAERAHEFDDAAAAARDVLRHELPTSLTPLSTARLHALDQARRRLVWVRNVAGIAASLIIGIGVGAWLTPNAAGRAPSPMPPVVHQPPDANLLAPAPPPPSSGFWSTDRLARAHRRSDPGPAARLIWDSPTTTPKLGGDS